MLVNADVNGSLNILRKHLNVVCDDIICPADRGLVMNPMKINFHKNVEKQKCKYFLHYLHFCIINYIIVVANRLDSFSKILKQNFEPLTA